MSMHGAPKMGGQPKSFRLQVLISRGLRARLIKAARRSNVSAGEWVRRAIDKALRESPAAVDPIAALASLGAPTADIDQMLAEIDAGRA